MSSRAFYGCSLALPVVVLALTVMLTAKHRQLSIYALVTAYAYVLVVNALCLLLGRIGAVRGDA